MELKKLFGLGPACFTVAAIVLSLAYYLEALSQFPKLPISDYASTLIFIIAILLTLGLAAWGILSLPPKKRGTELVTDKAFKYFRHPIYAAFLDFFIFGLGFYLKSFGILIAGVFLIFVCGKVVESEEKQLAGKFGKKYADYQKKTKKFVPWLY